MHGTKLVVLAVGSVMFAFALAVVLYDLWLAYHRRRATACGVVDGRTAPGWRMTVALLAVSWTPLLIAMSIVRHG
jgi:Na+/proline symporter